MVGKTKFKFERLHIWQDAMNLGEQINLITNDFPKKETYNLSSQICRAADSVALNISEGSIVQSKPELRKFLGYSVRSLAEVVTCLYKASNRAYISDKEFEKLYDCCFKLMNMIIAFRNKI
ncbi:MAG: four helix bundle protein [Muricauda sp.]|nr:four helix bundle protein [Allomuricauda sp.]